MLSNLLDKLTSLFLRLFFAVLSTKLKGTGKQEVRFMSRVGEEKAKRSLEPIVSSPIFKTMMVEILVLIIRAIKEWVDNDVED